jgi:hypothetical protein
MRSFLLWSMAFFATWVAMCFLAAVLLRWRLQRSNRVSPAVKSPAPITWLWVPTAPARLHRRLQLAARDIHLAPSRTTLDSPSLSVDDLRRQLESQAVELDHHLVAAARHPRRPRRVLLVQLSDQVTEVEQLSIRLSRLARPSGVPTSGWDDRSTTPEVLDRISEQLDLLDEAQRELTDIERAAGLIDVDAVFDAVRTPIAHQLPAPPVRR